MATVSVEVAEVAVPVSPTEAGEKDPLAPEGRPLTASDTVPVNPLCRASTVTV